MPTKGRFAPSPTGRMHLGNIYAALMSRRMAKAKGGTWLLRIEDNDPQRSRQEWADWIMDDLDWLGLTWDEGPYYQSQRLHIYDDCISQLGAKGLLYESAATRAERNAAAAPHENTVGSEESGVNNGMSCRQQSISLLTPNSQLLTKNLCLRATGTIRFTDTILGPQAIDLATEFGDFIVRRRDGAPAYQLATAIDDAMMGVTQVVRGDDLLLSTAPQRYVQSLLGIPMPTEYAHIPLLRAPDSRRLAKRDRSMAMDELRRRYTPEQIIETIDNYYELGIRELGIRN